jgi:hypothetical protein
LKIEVWPRESMALDPLGQRDAAKSYDAFESRSPVLMSDSPA